jgi:hypothetical protein
VKRRVDAGKISGAKLSQMRRDMSPKRTCGGEAPLSGGRIGFSPSQTTRHVIHQPGPKLAKAIADVEYPISQAIANTAASLPKIHFLDLIPAHCERDLNRLVCPGRWMFAVDPGSY